MATRRPSRPPHPKSARELHRTLVVWIAGLLGFATFAMRVWSLACVYDLESRLSSRRRWIRVVAQRRSLWIRGGRSKSQCRSAPTAAEKGPVRVALTGRNSRS